MPMIGHIYYPDSGAVPHEYAVAINIATLGGSIIGQLGFGLAGDWLGKRATGLRFPSC
jgi:PHS family inorganic phosphate transporter-like MFS transporter